VTSAASAATGTVAKQNAEKAILRATVFGQCNMVLTYAYLDESKAGVKKPH
jgi:hypothetical protein